MFFSRVRLDPGVTEFSRITKVIQSCVYREHQIIWDLFDNQKDSERDFLYRRFDLGRVPQFFVLSKRHPKNTNDIWSIETSPFQPKVNAGDQFSFNLRINPVVTKKIDGAKNPKSRKHDDVVMETRSKYKKSGKDMPSNNEIIHEAGIKWINEKAEKNGFNITQNQVIVEGYTQLTGKKDREGHSIQLGVLDYSGILKVTEPEKFTTALLTGIGRAKAFGCGLLLLKRI
jgi:CRISPR system Cascade subunit CasE